MKARFYGQARPERKLAYGEERLTLMPTTATLEQLYPAANSTHYHINHNQCTAA